MDQQLDRQGSKLGGPTAPAGPNPAAGAWKEGALSRHRFFPTRGGVIELIVLFALLMAIERVFMAPGDFAKLQPHPYWLPVLLLSLQYGSADGVLAATVAIVAGLLVGLPSQGVGEAYYHYVVRVWTVPIAWIMTAIVIGEVRARQRSHVAELTRSLATTRDQAENITRHCYRLEEKIQRLEREFATVEAHSLDSLIAAFLDLRRGGAQAWGETLGRVHRGLLGTGSTTLLLRQDQTLVPVASGSMGGGAREVAGSAVTAAPAALAAVFEAAAAGRRVLSADRPEDARLLDGIAAMAAPVVGEHGGAVLGMVLLEGLTPERLNVDTENRLDLLARELAQALAARGFDDLLEAGRVRARFALGAAERASQAPNIDAGPRRIELFPRAGRG